MRYIDMLKKLKKLRAGFSATAPPGNQVPAGLVERRQQDRRRVDRRVESELSASRRAKHEFLANISHELRTPLNGIFSMLHLLQQSNLNQPQQEWVDTAMFSANSLLNLLSDLIDLAQFENREFQLARQPVDLRNLLFDLVNMFQLESKKKNLSLRLMLSPELPSFILADQPRLRQVIFNILGNAIKFTAAGSVTVSSFAMPAVRPSESNIFFMVQDSGMGMSEEFLTRFFEPFAIEDASTTRKYPGAGLGLSIVTKLVALMGGSLDIDSAVFKGTCFTFCIPCEVVGTTEEPGLVPDFYVWNPKSTPHDANKCQEGPKPRVWGGKQPSQTPLAEIRRMASASEAELAPCLNILVAEDDAVSQFAILSILKKEGHMVKAAANGAEALCELVSALGTPGQYDCLITDIQMPVMDGIELVRRIRNQDLQGIEHWSNIEKNLALEEICAAIPADLPVIALTAHALNSEEKRFVSKGIDCYLTKPINIGELRTALKQVARQDV